MSDRSRVFEALLRTNLFYFVWKVFCTFRPSDHFVPTWSIKAIVYQLTRVQRREVNTLVINLPPRSRPQSAAA